MAHVFMLPALGGDTLFLRNWVPKTRHIEVRRQDATGGTVQNWHQIRLKIRPEGTLITDTFVNRGVLDMIRATLEDPDDDECYSDSDPGFAPGSPASKWSDIF